MKTDLLKLQLAKEKKCPVCGAELFRGQRSDSEIRRYECGSVFAVSARVEAIVASDPCPRGSNVAASLLTQLALAGKAVAA
jgi:hypothetical protein